MTIDRMDQAASKLDAWRRQEFATPVELLDLLKLEMPPREWLLEGLIQVRDLAMIHAFRGVGKSRVSHGLAIAVAGGGTFLRWRAPVPRGVLLVDGELPREDLQSRLAEAVEAADREPSAPLRVLSADLSDAPLPSLIIPEGRQRVERGLDGVTLLILDSISTLCGGAGPENDAESWESMQTWLLDLRRRGLTVMLIHHDGKGGRQRGTSKREDVLSTVLQLKRPSDYKPSQGARFEVHFTKSRGLVGEAAEPFEASLATGPEGRSVWGLRNLEDSMAVRVRELSKEGLTQREIAKDLGCGVATVNRALKRSSVPPPEESPAEQ